MFKFFLNGTEIANHPDGWDNISSTIKRDKFSGGLLYDADIKLTAFGGQDLYISLQAAWNTDRFGKSSFDIYQRSGSAGYFLIHAGTIFHTDLKWKLINNSVEFKVDDASWFAKINNNKSIEVGLDTTVSKNGVNISQATVFDLECHKVQNGTYYSHKRKAHKIYDAMEFIIRYMSDDTVGFESDTFGTGGIYEGYCLVNGRELADQTGPGLPHYHPRISWKDLFDEVYKRLNCRFAIVYSGGKPVIKVETESFFFDDNIAYTIPDIPNEVGMGIDSSYLYSGVRVGSSKFENTSSLQFPDITTLVSFKEEVLYFEGTNNVDALLDIVGDYVISNSSIDICLEQLSGYEGYSDDNFIIHYDTATNKTISSNWVGTAYHLYNEPLNNANILQRWSESFPGNVISNTNSPSISRAKAIYTGNDIIYIPYASLFSSSWTTNGPYKFDDDYFNGYDPSLSYGGSTIQGNPVSTILSIYTAATGGLYSFTATIEAFVTFVMQPGGGHEDEYAALLFKKFDASNNVIEDNRCSSYLLTANGLKSFTGGWTTYLNAGEYVAVYIDFKRATFTPGTGSYSMTLNLIPNNTYFSCLGADFGGGSITAANPDAYKNMKLTFKYPLTLEDYNTIRASKSGLISVPLPDNKSVRGWVENVKFEHISGETTFSLITDGNTVYR